jgi:hypothetical protein
MTQSHTYGPRLGAALGRLWGPLQGSDGGMAYCGAGFWRGVVDRRGLCALSAWDAAAFGCP